jgi:hypothetical protein
MAARLLEHFSSVKAKSLLNVLIVCAPWVFPPSMLNLVSSRPLVPRSTGISSSNATRRTRRKRAALAGTFAFALTIIAVYWGGRWWNVEAADYAADLYHPPRFQIKIKSGTCVSL